MDDTVLRYAAFTTTPAGGNPAGVVLDASELTDQQMLALAKEVGYSETAFVTRRDGRNLDVRYFSPEAEVSFCGHATVAAAVAVAERLGSGDLLFRTRAGEVPVAVDEALRATLTSVEPALEEVDAASLEQALRLLGWSAAELDPLLPPRIGYAGARHLILAAATRDRLGRLSYDFDGLAQFMRVRDLTTVALVHRESESVYHVRNPFPVGGVVEDPATGAAALAFGHYLRALGLVPATAALTLHQGDDMGRPGVLAVALTKGDARVRVSGTAVVIP
jgi:PhzF family phenazine biosynthesis protein